MTATTCAADQPGPGPTLAAARPARQRVARRVLEPVARRVPVDMRLPDGSLLGREPGAHPRPDRPVLEIVRPDALFDRIAREPKIGIGEGYMAGDWRAGPDTDLADAAAALRRSG